MLNDHYARCFFGLHASNISFPAASQLPGRAEHRSSDLSKRKVASDPVVSQLLPLKMAKKMNHPIDYC